MPKGKTISDFSLRSASIQFSSMVRSFTFRFLYSIEKLILRTLFSEKATRILTLRADGLDSDKQLAAKRF